MSKRRQLLRFVVLGAFGGAVVGVVASIPLIFFYVFGFFGLFFGVLFCLIGGAVLGVLNGFTFGILTFYASIEDEVQYHRRMLSTSALVTLLASFFVFSPILYMLTLNSANAIGGAIICASPIAVAATIPAVWASQRVKYRGI